MAPTWPISGGDPRGEDNPYVPSFAPRRRIIPKLGGDPRAGQSLWAGGFGGLTFNAAPKPAFGRPSLAVMPDNWRPGDPNPVRVDRLGYSTGVALGSIDPRGESAWVREPGTGAPRSAKPPPVAKNGKAEQVARLRNVLGSVFDAIGAKGDTDVEVIPASFGGESVLDTRALLFLGVGAAVIYFALKN